MATKKAPAITEQDLLNKGFTWDEDSKAYIPKRNKASQRTDPAPQPVKKIFQPGELIRVDLKPMGVNEAYSGERHNTPEHRAWNKKVIGDLPRFKLPEPPYQIHLTFGQSNPMADWDGPIKPTQDIIAEAYNFNDRLIRRCTGVDVVIVPKGEEFFSFRLEHLEVPLPRATPGDDLPF